MNVIVVGFKRPDSASRLFAWPPEKAGEIANEKSRRLDCDVLVIFDTSGKPYLCLDIVDSLDSTVTVADDHCAFQVATPFVLSPGGDRTTENSPRPPLLKLGLVVRPTSVELTLHGFDVIRSGRTSTAGSSISVPLDGSQGWGSFFVRPVYASLESERVLLQKGRVEAQIACDTNYWIGSLPRTTIVEGEERRLWFLWFVRGAAMKLLRLGSWKLVSRPKERRTWFVQAPADGWGLNDPTPAIWAEVVGVPHGYVSESWNDAVGRYSHGLRAIDGALQFSVVPRLPDELDSRVWTLRLSLRGRTPEWRAYDALGTGGLVPGRDDEPPPWPPEICVPVPRPLRVAFPAMKDTDGQPLEGILTAARGIPCSSEVWFEGRLSLNGCKPVRVGSLDVTFGRFLAPQVGICADVAADETISTFRLALDDVSRFAVEAALPVTRVAVGGQDDVPGEELDLYGTAVGDRVDTANFTSADLAEMQSAFERSVPVVIPLPSEEGPNEAPSSLAGFVLRARERNERPDKVRTLALDIERLASGSPGGTAPEPARVVVLDGNPFLVALVEFPEFRTIDAKTSDRTVASWLSGGPEGASWQIRQGSEPFTLKLPPQSLGEEMVGRQGQDDTAEWDEATERKGKLHERLDYRLGPPAAQRLTASYYPQNFVEAPWNLRRVLGYPGQRAPGAGVRELHYELLYGLSCKAVPALPFLRLAEVFSLVGQVPGPRRFRMRWEGIGKQRQVYAASVKEWGRSFRCYKSRLGVLEPWDTHQPDGLELSEGVTCDLRAGADLFIPIPSRPPADADAFPAPNCRGLRGGVTWGFQSARLYNAVVRNPRSTSAKLARPFFSSLGGWGFQKASFDRDLSSIYSDTAMGRTFSYTLERIGRVGVFWNLAKYVIVYERSTVPSQQFQDTGFLGRPVLRKVREYVEILQPVRNFPDHGAPPQTRGCVAGIDFKTRILNVVPTWSSNVRTSGWKIALWNREEGEQNPLVYPKPDIRQLLIGSKDGRPTTVPCPIDNPENLFFYTSIDKGLSSNPDEWPPVESVDFTSAPPPTAPSSNFKDGSMAALPRGEPEVPIGYAPFTFRLAEVPEAVNVVADRAEKALMAPIRSVTLARSIPSAPAAGNLRDTVWGALQDWEQKVNLNEARDLLESGAAGAAARAKATVKSGAASLKAKLVSACTELDKGVRALLERAKHEEEQAVGLFCDKIKEPLEEADRSLAGLAQITDPDALRSRLEATVAQLDGEIHLLPFRRGVGERAREELNRFSATMRCLLADAMSGTGEALAAIDRLDRSPAFANPTWGAVLRSVLAQMRAVCERAAGKLSSVKRDLETSLDKLDRLVTDLATTNPLTPVLDKGLEGLHAAVGRGTKALRAEISSFSKAIEDKRVGAQESARTAIEKIATLASIDCPDVAVPDLFTAEALEIYGRELEAKLRGVGEQLSGVWGSFIPQDVTAGFRQQAGTTLSLFRACGKPPAVEGLSFGPSSLAYYFDGIKPDVDLTPVLGKVNEAVDKAVGLSRELQTLSTKLPVTAALDRLIPANLAKFDLSKVLPDFGGIRLDKFLNGVKLPEVSNDRVKVTHGADPATRRAWVDVDVDFPLEGAAELFTIGPLVLRIRDAKFRAHSRVDGTLESGVSQKTEGKIKGDWELVVGGTQVVKLVETTMGFNSDKRITFDVSPDRVVMNEALQFIGDLVRSFSDPTSGFSVGLQSDGVKATLDLPLPDITSGTTSITSLRLGASLTLRFTPSFSIEVGFNIGKRTAPFALSIFILGGGGFIELAARYAPFTGDLTCRVDVGITASAVLAIALGPIKGGVYIYVGVIVQFESGGATPKPLTIGIMVLIRGEVSVLSIISAGISLLLEGTYSGGVIVARGRLLISIKISFFFTIKVNESVTYKIGSATSHSAREVRSPERLALARSFGTVTDGFDLERSLLADDPGGGGTCDQFDFFAAAYVDMMV